MSKKYTRQSQSLPKHPHYSSVAPITRPPITAVPTTFSSRPEWRGAGYHKPKKRAPPKVQSKSEREKELDIPNGGVGVGVQQKLLNVVEGAFPICRGGYEGLRAVLTAVRGRLDSDSSDWRTEGSEGEGEEEELGEGEKKVRFESTEKATFGEKDMREVFCVRWGVERALVLGALLAGWAESTYSHEPVFQNLRCSTRDGDRDLPLNVVCFGSGPAEMMALAVLLRQVQPQAEINETAVERAATNGEGKEETKRQPRLTLQIIQNSTSWTPELSSLLTALEAPPVLSKYASAAAKAAASPFLAPNSLVLHSHSTNVLDGDSKAHLASPPTHPLRPCLITLCFSLKTMQTTSAAKTVKFLMSLTKDAPKDSLLAVVDEVESSDADSAGVAEREKKYPLRFLLDLALLGKGISKQGEEEGGDEEKTKSEAAWEKLVGDEERIFKVDSDLKYPLSLGKIRMQVHLFKRR